MARQKNGALAALAAGSRDRPGILKPPSSNEIIEGANQCSFNVIMK